MRWQPQGVSPDLARRGAPGSGKAGFGLAGFGRARTANGSTEGFGLPYCSFGSRCGAHGRGWASFGELWSGLNWCGKDCEAQV